MWPMCAKTFLLQDLKQTNKRVPWAKMHQMNITKTIINEIELCLPLWNSPLIFQREKIRDREDTKTKHTCVNLYQNTTISLWMCFNHFYKLEFNTDAYYWLWIMIEKWQLKQLTATDKWRVSNRTTLAANFILVRETDLNLNILFIFMWKLDLKFIFIFSKSILFPQFVFFFKLTLLCVLLCPKFKKNLQVSTNNQIFHTKKAVKTLRHLQSVVSRTWHFQVCFAVLFNEVFRCDALTRFEMQPLFLDDNLQDLFFFLCAFTMWSLF